MVDIKKIGYFLNRMEYKQNKNYKNQKPRIFGDVDICLPPRYIFLFHLIGIFYIYTLFFFNLTVSLISTPRLSCIYLHSFSASFEFAF